MVEPLGCGSQQSDFATSRGTFHVWHFPLHWLVAAGEVGFTLNFTALLSFEVPRGQSLTFACKAARAEKLWSRGTRGALAVARGRQPRTRGPRPPFAIAEAVSPRPQQTL